MDELLLITSYFWHCKSKPHLKESDVKCNIKSQSFQHFPSAIHVSIEKQFIPAKWTFVWTNSVLFLHRPCWAGAVSPLFDSGQEFYS